MTFNVLAYEGNRPTLILLFLFIFQGDSGGPLVCKEEQRYVQYGITSFGSATGNAPNGLTNVYRFLQFIKDTIGSQS